MKKILLFTCMLAAGTAMAQPPARRNAPIAPEQNAAAQQRKASSYRTFPTAAPMPNTVVWQRDVYRELVLDKDANAVLYFPQTAQADGRENMFNYIFKQILRRNVTAYDYKLDGNENFDAKNAITAKELMDRYKIFYEEKDGRFRVNDADLPCEEVRSYFVKESIYFDQQTAQLCTRVQAICPVLHRADDYSGGITKYPMFWLKYADVAPWLGKLMLMGSNYNNASMLSADDYFTLNRYKGDIYKVTNLQDRLIANYCPTDSALKAEQARIEKEITDFEKRVWKGDSIPAPAPEEPVAEETEEKPLVQPVAPAATDSVAPAAEEKKTTAKRRTNTRRSSNDKATEPKKEKKKKTSTKVKRQSSSPSGGGGGLSVRRQRR